MRNIFFIVLCSGIVILVLPVKVKAVPVFARLYKTSCVTCHDVFPHLNAFGTAFRNQGYRYPKNQEPSFVKKSQISMGARAYKKLWPESIWPGNISAMTPIAVHLSARYVTREAPDGNNSFSIPAQTDFLFATTFDSLFSIFAEMEINTLKDIDYGFRFQYKFDTWLNLSIGKSGPYYWLSNHYRLLESAYYYGEWQNSSGSWQFKDGANSGIELWGNIEGAGKQGGLTYATGLGNGQSNSQNIDVNNHKDYYIYLSYQLGGMGVLGSIPKTVVNAGDYQDNLKAEAFYYNGLSTQEKINDTFILYGFTLSCHWHMIQTEVGFFSMNSRYSQQSTTRQSGFLSSRYTIYPWLWGMARYEYQTNKITGTSKTDKRIIPAIVALVRANIRITAEYLKSLDNSVDGGLRLNLNFAF